MIRRRWRSSRKVTSDSSSLPERSTKIRFGPLTRMSLIVSSFSSGSSGPRPMTSSYSSCVSARRSSLFSATDMSSSASLASEVISLRRLCSVAFSMAERFRSSSRRLWISTLSSVRRSLRFFSLSAATDSAAVRCGTCCMARMAELAFSATGATGAGPPGRPVGLSFLKRLNTDHSPIIRLAPRQFCSGHTRTWPAFAVPCAAGSSRHFRRLAGHGRWLASPARRRRAAGPRSRCPGFRPSA
jgi:hypothetical protein